MSVIVMSAVWRSTIGGSGERFVLLALADRADDDGRCWPGVQNLVQKTALSESTVKRALRRLEADGLLRTFPRFTTSGDRDTNGYQLDVAAIEATQLPRSAEKGRGTHPLDASLARSSAGSGGARWGQSEPTLGESAAQRWDHGEPTPGPADPTPDHREPTGGVTMTPNPSVDPSVKRSPQPPAAAGGERCPDHDRLRCRTCGHGTRAAAAVEADVARRAATTRERGDREREAAARATAVAACGLCDEHGYRGRLVCRHDTGQVERAARGRELVAAALAAGIRRSAS